MNEINVAFLGVGRMGMTHLRNLIGIPGVHVRVVADPKIEAARTGAAMVHAERASDNIAGAIEADDVDAVLICTPTTTHADLIERCVGAGKAVWCEKPVALTLEETQRVVNTVEECGVPVMIGFMRRFDPGYAAAKRKIEAGEIGTVERFRAVSCDYNPPSVAYIADSGGMFVDFFVHDLDLARFLVGEIDEVTAWGGVLVAPDYEAVGDVDTAVALLRFENGALGVLEGTRRATWGYDIRTEVAGSNAKLVIEAVQKTPLVESRDLGYSGDHYESFPDRFGTAYRAELEYFFACLRDGTSPTPGVRDALESLRVALAATKSLQENRPVKVAEIGSSALPPRSLHEHLGRLRDLAGN